MRRCYHKRCSELTYHSSCFPELPTHTHSHTHTLTHTHTHARAHAHTHTHTHTHTHHTHTQTQVNGKVLFEGILKLYWGLHRPIILAPGAAYAKQRNSVLNRASIYDFVGVDDASYLMMLEEATRAQKRRTLYENERRRLIEISENSFKQSGVCYILYPMLIL